MLKKFQSLLTGVLIGSLITGSMTFAKTGTELIQAFYADIKIVTDREQLTPKDPNGNIVEPFTYNGTTYLPVRAIGEAFDKEISWDEDSKTIY